MDNQLIGTTQPLMLFLTPRMSENEPVEAGPAVQINAMKFPSKNTMTDIYKVNSHLLFVPCKYQSVQMTLLVVNFY